MVFRRTFKNGPRPPFWFFDFTKAYSKGPYSGDSNRQVTFKTREEIQELEKDQEWKWLHIASIVEFHLYIGITDKNFQKIVTFIKSRNKSTSLVFG